MNFSDLHVLHLQVDGEIFVVVGRPADIGNADCGCAVLFHAFSPCNAAVFVFDDLSTGVIAEIGGKALDGFDPFA